jgi:hypothetical protein
VEREHPHIATRTTRISQRPGGLRGYLVLVPRTRRIRSVDDSENPIGGAEEGKVDARSFPERPGGVICPFEMVQRLIKRSRLVGLVGGGTRMT